MPNLRLSIVNRQRKCNVGLWEGLLKEALCLGFELAAASDNDYSELVDSVAVTLSFVSKDAIRDLNREQRGIDKATDVLSFPMLDFEEGELLEPVEPYDLVNPEAEKGELYLGDIVIAPVVALEQAELYGHSPEREAAFLAVHGLLHLLGYDHLEEEEEAVMRQKQRRIMEALGLGLHAAQPEDDARETKHTELESETSVSDIKRTGFIALVGRPNVGKSTLLNRISGSELAITSPKPQTTRHLIRAVINDGDAQMIFIDSPGIHPDRHALDRFMSKSISLAMDEADIILLMIEAGFKPRVDTIERRVAKRAEDRGKPLILLLNKTDHAKKSNILPLIDVFSKEMKCEAIVPISARTGEGLEALFSEIKRLLPEREAVFNEEEYTDQTEAVLAKELVRSEILRQMQDEIPHGTAVVLESFEEETAFNYASGTEERKKVCIEACIVCERESHKGMLLGKGGQRIREIGTKARERISQMLDCPCDLRLFVKVKENWRRKPQALEDLGYGSKEF